MKSQQLPVDGFKWKNDEFNLYEDFTQTIIKNDKGYILEVDINYPKELQKATKKCKKKDLCVTRKNMSYT